MRAALSLLAATSFVACVVSAQAPGPSSTRDLVLDRRIALVVGNDTYQAAPLANAVSDARAVSAALRALGFRVSTIENADRTKLANAIATVGESLSAGDVLFFFFAGHGIQIGGENYLIPVDFDTRSSIATRFTALALSDVQQALGKARVSLIVLDACRNNPFSGQRGATGFAPPGESRGSVVAFATSAGQVASDNPGATNGTYTQELLVVMREPGITARNLFQRTRERVYTATGGGQLPAIYDGLVGDVALSLEQSTAVAGGAEVGVRISDELLLWRAIEGSIQARDYDVYLAKYPNGIFAELARSRASAHLTPSPVPVPATPLAMSQGLVVVPSATPEQWNPMVTCRMPYGTVAINEPHEPSLIWLRTYQLGSPSSLLRTFAQKSNCFVVVERGVGMQNINQERQLGSSGELQSGQNVGKGQIVAADFLMTPAIQSSNNNAGGIGGVGGLLGRRASAIVGGGLKFKEAKTSITVASARTSVQIAANEGQVRERDFGVRSIFSVGGLLGGAGAYSNTAEGKVIAASLIDNFNAVVSDMIGNANLKPMSADRLAKLLSGESEAEGSTGPAANAGDVMVAKLAGVRIMGAAADTAAVVATLQQGEAVVYMGEESNGFYKVQGAGGEGYVKKALMNVNRR
jgi:curli biogenesis system outer membrane secretion channel CsgG